MWACTNFITGTRLDLDVMQLTVEFFEFQNFSNEEISVAMSHFGIRDVDHVVVDVKVKLKKKMQAIVISTGVFWKRPEVAKASRLTSEPD